MIFQPTSLTSAKAGSWAHQKWKKMEVESRQKMETKTPKTNKPGSLRWLSCFEFLLPVGNAISITFFCSLHPFHPQSAYQMFNLKPAILKQLNFTEQSVKPFNGNFHSVQLWTSMGSATSLIWLETGWRFRGALSCCVSQHPQKKTAAMTATVQLLFHGFTLDSLRAFV